MKQNIADTIDENNQSFAQSESLLSGLRIALSEKEKQKHEKRYI